MADFNKIFSALEQEIVALAKNTFTSLAADAIADAKDYLTSSRAELEEWTILLADKEITPDEFEDLLKGQKDLLKLKALKQTGIAKVRLQAFSNDVLSLVKSTILSLI